MSSEKFMKVSRSEQERRVRGKPGLPFLLAFPFHVHEHLCFFLWVGLAFQRLSGFLFSSLVPGQDSGRRM